MVREVHLFMSFSGSRCSLVCGVHWFSGSRGSKKLRFAYGFN